MANIKTITKILRLAVAGEFLGHGVFALQGKEVWIGWIQQLTGIDYITSGQILVLVGILDIIVALLILVKPIRIALLWAVFWGFWTALMRPLVGEPIWDFVERWANWGAPLALLLLIGWPKNVKELFK